MFEKDGIVYENEEEYISENKNPEKKKHSSCLTVIIAFLIVFFIFFILPLISLGFMIKDEYHIFTKKRIAEMEEKFNITVTDDFDLVRYERHSWQGTSYKLEIEGIDDYRDFMENNVNGTVEELYIRDYDAGFKYTFTKQGYDTEEYYDYSFKIMFSKEDDGTYSAVLINY